MRIKSRITQSLLLSILMFGFVNSNAQGNHSLKNHNPDLNGEPWYSGNLSDEGISESWADVQLYESNTCALKSVAELPSMVNNSVHKFFRPIFNQSGGSCSQASGIGYVFTYEMNWIRNTDAKSTKSNQYPSHFTWNFLNGGNGSGSYFPDAWRIAIDHGIPNLVDYGGGMASLGSTGWMNGYDKYLNALKNRCISSWKKVPINTPGNIDVLKKWLFNHDMSGETYGGIASFYGKTDKFIISKIPQGNYQSGKSVITAWGESGGHAMTIVGYDDSIRWDFNNDGEFTNDIDINGDGVVNPLDWEIGAWIIANSWGASWRDNGFAYVPYQLLATSEKFAGIISTFAEYNPKLVMKVNIEYEKRDQLKIIVGINQNIDSFNPIQTKEFSKSFNYKGGAHPFLGEGNNGIGEIALDLSDFLSNIDISKPVKVFLRIATKNQASPAIGYINKMSVISYIKNPQGEEIISDDALLPILHNTNTTATVIVPQNLLGDYVSSSNYKNIEDEFSIAYSNNVLNIISFDSNSSAKISILNINGQLIHCGNLNRGTNEYEMKTKGVYIVLIQNSEELVTRKIVVQ